MQVSVKKYQCSPPLPSSDDQGTQGVELSKKSDDDCTLAVVLKRRQGHGGSEDKNPAAGPSSVAIPSKSPRSALLKRKASEPDDAE